MRIILILTLTAVLSATGCTEPPRPAIITQNEACSANQSNEGLKNEVYIEKLADAIYHAENSKSHPYGIMQKYKHTSPRQACKNTIISGLKRFAKQSKETDFVYFLSLTYCPIGATNDPTGLNKNWVSNVKYFINNPKPVKE